MSEYERGLAEPIDLYDILGNGSWHPVISPLSFELGEPTTLWISEYFEHLGKDGPIHDKAEAFRVDFTAEGLTREGPELAAVGKTDLIDMPHLLHLASAGDRVYVRMEHEIPKVAESTFKALMSHAVSGVGVPFETPLRWHHVHNLAITGGVGNEVARYIMGDFGDGRTFMITHEKGQDVDYTGPWIVESKTPVPNGSGNYVETKIHHLDTKPTFSSFVMDLQHGCVDVRTVDAAEEIKAMVDLLNEAVAVLPDKQREFLESQKN